MIYSQLNNQGYFQIYSYDFKNKRTTLLSDGRFDEVSPVFSGDPQQVTFKRIGSDFCRIISKNRFTQAERLVGNCPELDTRLPKSVAD
ncbi:MAG: hypothetical protein MJK04_04045 [Psychrosphaera sp.]|nr:hypothetical protein [Psychrosphaera sp.]